jgi:DNA mismatch repair protein MSH6
LPDVARLAGVPSQVVARADIVSKQFHEDFKQKLAGRKVCALPLVAQSDFQYLMGLIGGLKVGKVERGEEEGGKGGASVLEQLEVIKACIGRY